MPKLKTHKGAAKRFKKTGSGGIKRKQAFKNHILTYLYIHNTDNNYFMNYLL